MPSTKNTGHILLQGSLKEAPEATQLNTLNPNNSIEITIRVRRKKSIEKLLAKEKRLTYEEYEKDYGAAAEDITLVESFAHQNHLSVSGIDIGRRSIHLKGKIRDFEDAFKIQLSNYTHAKGKVFRARVGHISIPANLDGIVEGVFGLDTRPIATPKIRRQHKSGKAHATAFNGYSAADVAKAYGFPKKVTGKGQTIGIIELGGGYKVNDLNTYFAGQGIKTPSVTAVSVNGGTNDPQGKPDSDDGEVLLDIEVAGTIAPKANIVVYFTTNTDQGFLDAVTTAIHDKVHTPSVISISWGSAEKNWTKQALNSFNQAFQSAALLGITITVATGDNGSGDNVGDKKVHADFPASCPYVLATGGTKLEIKNGKVGSEVVWNGEPKGGATGGGISDFFPLPDYQKKAKVPASLSSKFKGRGIPDVCGNADPVTGYKVVVDGTSTYFGGTSAVAPLYAGFIALINQQKGTKAGFINPLIYKDPKKHTRDITTPGNNTSTPPGIGYDVAVGWDAATGLGVLQAL